MIERIASCACGKVRYCAAGAPIVTTICYCGDCQAGGRMLEAAGAHADFRDAFGGTPYMTYRNDRLDCLEGAALLEGYKLNEAAPTTRYVATCCNSAVMLTYGPGWWTSMYRVRFGAAATPLEFRSSTAKLPDPGALPRDLPAYRGFPPALFARLIGSGLGTLLARRAVRR